MAKQDNRHKGSFVGGYFSKEQIQKIDAVEKLYDEHFGDPGRNRSRALRWFVDSIRPEWIENFPKSPAPASASAQMEMAK